MIPPSTPFRFLTLLAAFLLWGCQSGKAIVDPIRRDTSLVVALNQMPELCLKQLYIRCSRGASQGSLSLGEVAACSQVYETLLQQGFGGDFHAFLGWSRLHPDDGPEIPFDHDSCSGQFPGLTPGYRP